MSRQVTIQTLATGSTDAVGKAKQTARELGHRIQTVASVRLTPGIPAPADTAREQASWTVVLAVRDAS